MITIPGDFHGKIDVIERENLVGVTSRNHQAPKGMQDSDNEADQELKKTCKYLPLVNKSFRRLDSEDGRIWRMIGTQFYRQGVIRKQSHGAI